MTWMMPQVNNIGTGSSWIPNMQQSANGNQFGNSIWGNGCNNPNQMMQNQMQSQMQNQMLMQLLMQFFTMQLAQTSEGNPFAVGQNYSQTSNSNTVNLARQEIGVSGQEAHSRYGEPGAWCAAFATEMYNRANGTSSTPVGNSHSVKQLVANANTQGRFHNTKDFSGAKPGDFIVFGNQQHVGIVASVDPDGTVHTIEGNASNQVKAKSYASGNSWPTGYISLG